MFFKTKKTENKVNKEISEEQPEVIKEVDVEPEENSFMSYSNALDFIKSNPETISVFSLLIADLIKECLENEVTEESTSIVSETLKVLQNKPSAYISPADVKEILQAFVGANTIVAYDCEFEDFMDRSLEESSFHNIFEKLNEEASSGSFQSELRNYFDLDSKIKESDKESDKEEDDEDDNGSTKQIETEIRDLDGNIIGHKVVTITTW